MDYLRIVADQKEDLAQIPLDDYCLRRKVSEIEMDSPLAQVVIGMRRSGKTTMCLQALHIAQKAFAYLNFDDEALATASAEDLNHLLEAMHIVYGDFTHIFLDEIQNIEGWELFVNRLLRKGLHVVLTGSNSNTLSQELGSHLTGRYKEIELLPFSFAEFLSFNHITPDTTSTRGRAELQKAYHYYAAKGGIPEALMMADSRNYVKTLYNAILFKDVTKRYNVRYPKVLSMLSSSLMQNFCREVSCLGLAKELSVKSVHTIQNYVDYLEKAYLIKQLPRFSFKPSKKQQNNKAYAIDLGMVSSFSGIEDSETNWGWRMENLVFLKLYSEREDENYELFYWNNGVEVDFVIVEENGAKSLIQVCYSLDKKETRERECTSLIAAARKLHCTDLSIVNMNLRADWEEDGLHIKVIPVIDFLLIGSSGDKI